MDYLDNTELLSSICKGCLSIDRKLTEVEDEKRRNFFNEVLDPLESSKSSLLLCWECLAAVKRTLAFKEQVRLAHQLLVAFVLHHSTSLQTLSRLTTTKLGQQIKIYQTNCDIDQKEDSKQIVYKNNEYEQTFNEDIIVSSNGNNKVSVTNKSNKPSKKKIKGKKNSNLKSIGTKTSKVKPEVLQSSNQCTFNSESTNNHLLGVKIDNALITNGQESITNDKKQTNDQELKLNDDKVTGEEFKINNAQPLAFIKVEGQEDDIDDDFEASFVDIGDDVEDKDFKAVLSAEQQVRQIKPHPSDDFDDSDDEPLTLKISKEPTESKPVRRRRPTPSGVKTSACVARQLQKLHVPAHAIDMVVLDWHEVEAERQQALQSEAFTRHTYRCEDCVVGFNHRQKLEDHHARKHAQSVGAWSCSVCRVRCRSAHALSAHRRRHRVRWRCVSCGGAWSRAASAADHWAKTHAGPTDAVRHECSTCGHKEPTLAKLRNHLRSHREKQKCELCGKTFRDRSALRTHLFIHNGAKEHACPSCGKMFLFKKAMELHATTHEEHKQLYCHQCDMTFKNHMSFYQHMKYNLKHIDPAKLKHACQLCDKKFAKAIRLEEHNLAVHLKATPIRCAVEGCTFACSSRPVLRTHTRMVHRGKRLVRNHVCHACGKSYTTKKSLEGHLRVHSGERPLRCSRCPAAFRYDAALYNHTKLVHLRHKSVLRGSSSSEGPPAPAPAPLWPTTVDDRDVQTTQA